MAIFDTDIIIWTQRGNKQAALLIEKIQQRYLSLQSYMELLQGARNKEQHHYIKSFLNEYAFTLLPITEKISYRASIYIEEFSLVNGMRAGDALIAATAVEHTLELVTSNKKHFKDVRELELKIFKPRAESE